MYKILLAGMLVMASHISALAQEVTVSEWEEVFYNQLTRWSNNYQEFDVSQIVLVSKESLANNKKIESYTNNGEWEHYTQQYQDFILYSPDQQHFIDLLYTTDIRQKSGKYYAIPDGNQVVCLGMESNKTTIMIAEGDRNHIIEDAHWIDKDRVLLVGQSKEIIQKKETILPFILLYNLPEKALYHYEVKHSFLKKGKKYTASRYSKLIFDFDKAELNSQ